MGRGTLDTLPVFVCAVVESAYLNDLVTRRLRMIGPTQPLHSERL